MSLTGLCSHNTAPDPSSDFDASASLADVDEQDWPDALDFFAVTAHKCWHCGGENHYARDCPNKSQMQAKSKAIGAFVGTIHRQLPSGFQVTSNRFPNLSQCRMPSLPNNTQQQAHQLADYYQPLLPTAVQSALSKHSWAERPNQYLCPTRVGICSGGGDQRSARQPG
jgi:hypothetical protein